MQRCHWCSLQFKYACFLTDALSMCTRRLHWHTLLTWQKLHVTYYMLHAKLCRHTLTKTLTGFFFLIWQWAKFYRMFVYNHHIWSRFCTVIIVTYEKVDFFCENHCWLDGFYLEITLKIYYRRSLKWRYRNNVITKDYLKGSSVKIDLAYLV